MLFVNCYLCNVNASCKYICYICICVYGYILFHYNYLVSDTCASGEKEDESGPTLKKLINNKNEKSIGYQLKGEVSCAAIVKDEEDLIIVTT